MTSKGMPQDWKACMPSKRVLITLPLTDADRMEFAEIVAAHGCEACFVREQNVMPEDIEGVSVIVGNVPAWTLSAPEGLEWLQCSSAGYDHYLGPGVLAANTKLCSAVGCYGHAVSEHMFAQLMSLMKKLHLYRDNQRVGAWQDEGMVTTLVGARVLMIGAGDIGCAFARLCSAFGAEVWGVRRRVGERPEPFSRMFALDEVFELLPQVDVVAAAVPSSDETRGLADARFFEAMKSTAFFVNAGRGDLCVTDDLVAALNEGQIAGVALDVFDPEPLPQGHALWACDNALITPHVAGFWHLADTTRAVIALCRRNLVAYLAGEPLENLVRG